MTSGGSHAGHKNEYIRSESNLTHDPYLSKAMKSKRFPKLILPTLMGPGSQTWARSEDPDWYHGIFECD